MKTGVALSVWVFAVFVLWVARVVAREIGHPLFMAGVVVFGLALFGAVLVRLYARRRT